MNDTNLEDGRINATDARVRRAYGLLHAGHDALRQDLLARLPAPGTPPAPTDARARRWRAAPPWALGLAAAVVLAAGTWVALFRAPRPAYAIDQAPSRLAALRSVHVEGWELIDGFRFPFRMYVEEGAYYYCHTMTSTEHGRTFMGTNAGDRKHHLSVLDRDRTATVGSEVPLATELRTRMLMQFVVPSDLLGSDVRGFRVVGAEKVGKAAADVYERRDAHGSRRVVWLSRESGLPVQVARYARDPTPGPNQGRERQTSLLRVTPNAPRPDDLPATFDPAKFEPPAGYKVVRADRTAEGVLSNGSGTAGEQRIGVLLALDIGGKAVLLGWTHHREVDGVVDEPDLGGPAGRPETFPFPQADGGAPYDGYRLRDDPWNGKFHARWTLLVPPAGQPLGDLMLRLDGPNTSVGLHVPPLRFDRERLERILAEAQKLTLGPKAAAAPGALLTLEQLETMARAKAGANGAAGR